MDEDQDQGAYAPNTPAACAFEQGLRTRRASCHHAQSCQLGHYEIVNCNNPASQLRCRQLLLLLQLQTRFTFKQRSGDAPLTFEQTVKLQLGTLDTLNAALGPQADIDQLLTMATAQYGSFDHWPLETLIRGIAMWKRPRPLRRPRPR